jgi:glycosyltransferase involved in cell wall biosynthesis
MGNPRVSVLMLTYNRPQFISRAIESIRAQTLTDWELIVVHDGPNLEIQRIMHEWEERDPRIRYFHRAQPGNIAEANNYGLARAVGRYVAILDDDDYWRVADKLERQTRFLDEHPDSVVCGGGAVCIDPEGRETLRYLKAQSDEEIKRRALVANPMVHSATLFRRDAAEQCGFYDVTLAGFQDWDLFLKLGRLGRLYNFQEHFLAYQIWAGGGSFHAQRGNTRSALRIVWRHRHHYRGFLLAITLATLYYLYSLLPVAVRKLTFSFLSRLKKAVFATRPQAAEG